MRLLLVGAFPYPHHQGSQVYFQEQAIALRSAGAYPYAVDGADAPGLSTTPLAGELYVCSTDQLDRLDALEDHPSYYKRRLVRLRGDDAEAWMYVLRDADALANVRARPDAFADAAGDWRSFLERTN